LSSSGSTSGRARRSCDPNEWSDDEWPVEVRDEVDVFVDRLRSHATDLPVIHFVEWADLWSMGDLFLHWLTPPDGPQPLIVHTKRFEVYGYCLPDAGRLKRHLRAAGDQQFAEYDYFVNRLNEALAAWESLVERAVLVVVREAVGGLVTDDELLASLVLVPHWLGVV
jgi:hypothetical protein